jgi:hypothetical protein
LTLLSLAGGYFGAPNTTAFVLLAGYRPKFDKVFAVVGTNGGVPVER